MSKARVTSIFNPEFKQIKNGLDVLWCQFSISDKISRRKLARMKFMQIHAQNHLLATTVPPKKPHHLFSVQGSQCAVVRMGPSIHCEEFPCGYISGI